MNRSVFASMAIAIGLVLAAGAVPGCNCAHHLNHGGDGDGGGGGGGGDGGGSGGGGPCGDDSPSCVSPCLGPTCTPPSMFPLPGDVPPNPNVGADGVNRNPMGYIVLDSTKASFNYIWIANDQNYFIGTVSKIDTRPRTDNPGPGAVNKGYREVARYLTVTCQSDPEPTHWPDLTKIPLGHDDLKGTCDDGVHGCCARDQVPGQSKAIQLWNNRPSRTAVDFNGDVWVANRAHDALKAMDNPPHQSSVSKIANKNNSITDTDCIDRNHNGKIDTSYDANGDGIIDTDCNEDQVPDSLANVAANPCKNGKKQEFFGLDDECILFTVNTGAEGGTGRPLALGPGASDFAPSDAWAGRFSDATFYRIDGLTGKIKETVQLQPKMFGANKVASNPYGAAIDSYGILWAPNIDNHTLFYFDTKDPAHPQNAVTPPPPAGQASPPGHGFYGVAIDGFKTGAMLTPQVWMAAYQSPGAFRYRPPRTGAFADLANGDWAGVTFTGDLAKSNGRGVGVDNRQPTSFAWVAVDGGSAVGRIPTNIAGGYSNLDTIYSTGGSGTLGAGVSADLDVWAINQGSSSATHFKVDGAGNVTAPGANDQVSLDENQLIASTALRHQPSLPYTYSDFTGFGLRNFTNPHGFYSYIQTGCRPGHTRWVRLLWDGDTPAGTTLTAKVRTVDDLTALSRTPYTPNFTSSPAELSPTLSPTGFLQVEFDLTTNSKDATPALKSFTVVYECVNVIG